MGRNIFRHDPDIGFSFIPNLKARLMMDGGGYLMQTDSLGFRNDHFNQNSDHILFTGDSYLAGDGVSNKFRFTNIFSKQTGIPVYNLGLSGTGTGQQFLLYKKYASQISHKALVICIQLENIRRICSKYRIYYNSKGEMMCFQKPFFALNGDSIDTQNIPVPKEILPYKALSENEQTLVDTGGSNSKIKDLITQLGLKPIAQQVFKPQPFKEYDSVNSNEWLVMKGIIKTWVKSIDVPVKILLIPPYQYIENLANPKSFLERFDELQNELKIEILNPLNHLREYPIEERKEFRFPNDPHLSREGHLAIGNYLKDNLSIN